MLEEACLYFEVEPLGGPDHKRSRNDLMSGCHFQNTNHNLDPVIILTLHNTSSHYTFFHSFHDIIIVKFVSKKALSYRIFSQEIFITVSSFVCHLLTSSDFVSFWIVAQSWRLNLMKQKQHAISNSCLRTCWFQYHLIRFYNKWNQTHKIHK